MCLLLSLRRRFGARRGFLRCRRGQHQVPLGFLRIAKRIVERHELEPGYFCLHRRGIQARPPEEARCLVRPFIESHFAPGRRDPQQPHEYWSRVRVREPHYQTHLLPPLTGRNFHFVFFQRRCVNRDSGAGNLDLAISKIEHAIRRRFELRRGREWLRGPPCTQSRGSGNDRTGKVRPAWRCERPAWRGEAAFGTPPKRHRLRLWHGRRYVEPHVADSRWREAVHLRGIAVERGEEFEFPALRPVLEKRHPPFASRGTGLRSGGHAIREPVPTKAQYLVVLSEIEQQPVARPESNFLRELSIALHGEPVRPGRELAGVPVVGFGATGEEVAKRWRIRRERFEREPDPRVQPGAEPGD